MCVCICVCVCVCPSLPLSLFNLRCVQLTGRTLPALICQESNLGSQQVYVVVSCYTHLHTHTLALFVSFFSSRSVPSPPFLLPSPTFSLTLSLSPPSLFLFFSPLGGSGLKTCQGVYLQLSGFKCVKLTSSPHSPSICTKKWPVTSFSVTVQSCVLCHPESAHRLSFLVGYFAQIGHQL